MMLKAIRSLFVLLLTLFFYADAAPPPSSLARRQGPTISAPTGWKASWNVKKRVSNGSSTGFLGSFTVDKTATAVTQAHATACMARCASTAKCGFVNLIKMQGSSMGNVACLMFPKYLSSSSASYTTGPQGSGGKVEYSYGFRSLCAPTNGGKLTCTPQSPVAVVTTTAKPTSSALPTTSTTTTTTSSTATTPVYTGGSATGLPLPKYNLYQANRGSSFYSNDNWDFWNLADPTHGTVQYVDEATAVAQNLIGINNNNQAFAQVSTDNLPLGQNRPSVRFQSKQAFDAALVVLDVVKMPVGCATWPALWTVAGSTWPENGEIDIVEGVGYTSVGNNANLVSVHMNQTAYLSSTSASYTGKLTSNNCMTNYGLGNTGCSFRDTNANGASWGTSFNNNGGGIWAALWGDGMGVKVWYWGRQSGKIPNELRNPSNSPGTLDPSSWGKPMANFQSTLIDQKLKQQNIVLDITLNGDWAGNVAMDNQPTCGTNRTTALANGANYNNAQFILNAIDVYSVAS